MESSFLYLCIIFCVTLILAILTSVSSYTVDPLIPIRRNCVLLPFQNSNSSNSNSYSHLPLPLLRLDCSVRKLSVDFTNYSFNSEQIEQTHEAIVKCNPALYFESFLDSRQVLFQFSHVKSVQIEFCKIKKVPAAGVWRKLSLLKSLALHSYNGDWKGGSFSLTIESGGFDGLNQLEDLDLSQNNILSLSSSSFSPLENLLALNLSYNRLSRFGDKEGEEQENAGLDCHPNCTAGVLPYLQNLDLSSNIFRIVKANGFAGLDRLIELRLQKNRIEQIQKSGFSGLGHLRILNLSANRLSEISPFVFLPTPILTELYLQNNSIAALSPKVFETLKYLRVLDLSRNSLTTQSSGIQDKVFNGLVELIVLRLSFNSLDYIDPTLFSFTTKLQVLYLDNNQIDSISPGAFAALQNLKSIDLSRNRLTSIDSPELFRTTSALRHLYLDHNQIHSIHENALENCKLLQDVGMAGNRLEEIPTTFRSSGLGSLTTLDIGENRIGELFNNSFLGMEQLYGLRLVDNKIKSIPPGFCQTLVRLRVLNLAQNLISNLPPGSFSGCPEIRALRLDINKLDHFPESLAGELPNLLWLNLSRNAIKQIDYRVLPPTVEWLDLSYNSLEILGPMNMNANVAQQQLLYHLRVIDASHNNLTLLHPLSFPSSLETLRVNHNQLRNVSPDTFRNATHLRRVELMWNKLKNLPMSSLKLSPFPLNKHLPEFYLTGNPFLCDCSMEWLSHMNQLLIHRQFPRIADLDGVKCQLTRSANQTIPFLAAKPSDFLCPYKSHCFALCHCCDFGACDCAMTCPENCTCLQDTSWTTNIVICSNLNYQEIPPQIPIDATELYLDGNFIPTLSSHIFIGKKNLRLLALNSSHVEFIKNRTFHGLRSLETLHLQNNQLSRLYGHEFTSLMNLKELYLQNNLLTHISPEVFSSLRFLQVLSLDGNLLAKYNVWELNINGHLTSVTLASNPWSCQCEFVIPFRTWLASAASNHLTLDFTAAKSPTCEVDIVVNSLTGEHERKRFPLQSLPCGGGDVQSDDNIFNLLGNHHENENENSISLISPEGITNHLDIRNVAIRHVGFGSANVNAELEDDESHSHSAPAVIWIFVLTVSLFLVFGIFICFIFRKSEIPLKIKNFAVNTVRCGCGCDCSVLPVVDTGKISTDESRTRNGENCEYQYSDSVEKLFDAYFLYSKSEEDMVIEKITSELEKPSGVAHFSSSLLRLCLHYRDLCLSSNSDGPVNKDMILSACGASRRIFVILSQTFLHSELSNCDFHSALQSAMYRYHKCIYFILLPPLNALNVNIAQIVYPEFKNHTYLNPVLDWMDSKFWIKLNSALPPIPSSSSSLIKSRQNQNRQNQLNHHNRISLHIPTPRFPTLPPIYSPAATTATATNYTPQENIPTTYLTYSQAYGHGHPSHSHMIPPRPPDAHYQENQSISLISQSQPPPPKYRSNISGNPYLNLQSIATRNNRNLMTLNSTNDDELEHLYSTLDSLHTFSNNT